MVPSFCKQTQIGSAASYSPQQIPAPASAACPPATSTGIFPPRDHNLLPSKGHCTCVQATQIFFPLQRWHFIFRSRYYLIISAKLASSRPKLTPGLCSGKILQQILQPFSEIMLSISWSVYYSVAHMLCESRILIYAFSPKLF